MEIIQFIIEQFNPLQLIVFGVMLWLFNGSLDKKFDQMDKRFANLETELRDIKKDIVSIKTDLSSLDKQISILVVTMRFNGFDFESHKVSGE